MVEELQPGLAAHANTAAIDRRIGIAFDLDRAAVHDAHAQAAARRAQAAGGKDELLAARAQPMLDRHRRFLGRVRIPARTAPRRHASEQARAP